MIRNETLSTHEFEAIREAVLQTWPTGKDVNLEEGLSYHAKIPPEKNFAVAMSDARARGRTLLQPRAGVALIDEHIQLLKYLENEGGADLLPTTIDAYTRQNRYEEAQVGIEKSRAANTSLLNGFPAVNHGVAACRKVVDSVNSPIQVRHGTPDARLLAEITLAAGFTSFEGGGISYNIPYTKKVSLEQSIRDWQYVDRLTGIYEERGARINREPFGPLTGTLVPPFISHTIGIIEGLLALKQGVRSITLGYGQAGNILQDIAAIVSLRELARETFAEAGHPDVDLSVVFHQWMGGFPENEAKAFSVICWGSVVAGFAKPEKIIVKTPHEAMGIPTRTANAQGLQATRQTIQMLEDQRLLDTSSLRQEVDLIRREVRNLIDKVIELGEGDLAAGTVAAFKAGVLDIPFAPSVHNAGKVMPIRDNQGFLRVFRKGNLPLDAEVMAYHQERLLERSNAEGRPVSFQMVSDDIYAISKGKLIGRPK